MHLYHTQGFKWIRIIRNSIGGAELVVGVAQSSYLEEEVKSTTFNVNRNQSSFSSFLLYFSLLVFNVTHIQAENIQSNQKLM